MKRENKINSYLPSGYRRLEYLESDETQYIDTNWVIPHGFDFGFEFDFAAKGTWGQNGLFWSNESGSIGICFSSSNKIYIAFSKTYVDRSTQTIPFDTDFHHVVLKRGYQQIDSNVWHDETLPTVDFYGAANPQEMPYILFGRRHNWFANGNNVYPMKIGNYKIFENDSVVRDFVPALRKSDNKPGMYDLCGSICPLTGTPFYTNAGSGEFLYK